MKKYVWLLLMLPMLAAPLVMPGAELSGVKLAEKVEIEGHEMALNGMALRKRMVFKVYVAALYLQTRDKQSDSILARDEARRMEMHFLRSVSAKQVGEAWLEGLAANTPQAGPDLKERFDKLLKMMVDLKKGDVMSFTYVPGSGTTVEAAGQVKGLIPGRDFSDALLACWIGPNPGPGESFKKELLGN